MDWTEWIALAIVVGALFFWVRRLFFSKKSSCCDKKCEGLTHKAQMQKNPSGENSAPPQEKSN